MMDIKGRNLSIPIEFRFAEIVDDAPDYSYLGEYSHKPGPGAIDREERGDMGRNEYRYWNPTNHAKFNPENWAHVRGKKLKKVLEEFGSLEKAEEHYREQDYKRHEAASRGDWCHVIYKVTAVFEALEAEAVIGGIESDATPEYKAELIKQLTDEAMGHLFVKIKARCEVE